MPAPIGGQVDSFRVITFSSTQDAVDALQYDSSMIGDVILVPSEHAVGVVVNAHRIFATSEENGAFDKVPERYEGPEADAANDLLRSFPAFEIALNIGMDNALYTCAF